MGRELCARIGGAGFPTLAYDVNPEAAKYAEDQFENVTQSDLLIALKNSAVVFSCLPNSNLVREIVNKMLDQEGILDNLKYWVDTTSGHPGESRAAAARRAMVPLSHHVNYVCRLNSADQCARQCLPVTTDWPFTGDYSPGSADAMVRPQHWFIVANTTIDTGTAGTVGRFSGIKAC